MSLYKTLIESSKSTVNTNRSSSYIPEDSPIFEYNLSLLGEVNNTIAQKHLDAFNETLFDDVLVPHAKARFNFNRLVSDMVNLNVYSINTMFKKSEDIMKSVTKEDARIKPYVNDIINFNKSFKITEGVYNFTNLDIDIPPYDLHRRIEEEFDKIYGKVNIIASSSNSSIEIEDKILSLYMELSGDSYYKPGDIYNVEKSPYKLDEKLLKGILSDISVNTSLIYIDSEDYEEKIYMYFRDGKKEPTIMDITPEFVKMSFNRYNASKITMRNLRIAKDNLVKSYSEIKKSTDKSYELIYSKLPTDKSKAYMDKIMRYEVIKMMYFCNGYDLLFAGRLDANTHAMLQDKKITLYAIQTLLK